MPAVNLQHDLKFDRIFGDKKIGKSQYNIFYGVELEYEVETPAGLHKPERIQIREEHGAKIAPLCKDFAFLKHDGSLKNGFEIVTCPMSLDIHRDKWGVFFKKLPKKSGIFSRTNCGLHIHVSRELISPLQIGKILCFIYNKQNFDFIKKIARRVPPKKYSEFGPKKITDYNRHTERYSAVNLRNPSTIEFRFFKSAVRKEEVLYCLEFCDALIRITWPSKCGINQIKNNGLDMIFNYVKEHNKEYPNLYKFLIRNKYIR